MIPDFQSAMLPILSLLSDGGTYTTKEIREFIVSKFEITDAEQQQRTPNNKQVLYQNRIAWSISYLKSGNLITTSDRGRYQITPLGIKVAKHPPAKITIKFLKELLPENIEIAPPTPQTPDEMIDEGFKQIRAQLSQSLIEILEKVPPYKFEMIVLDLLIRMGYGDKESTNGSLTPKSGDEGIDGIIKEDKLGLDKIYFQAKRWQKEGKIGRPELQKFVGALDGKKAKKGIFITTAFFSDQAIEYAGNTTATIVLIDGNKLTSLMIDYGVGTRVVETYRVNKIDADYFLEE